MRDYGQTYIPQSGALLLRPEPAKWCTIAPAHWRSFAPALTADPFGIGRIAFTSEHTADLVQDWLEWRGPHISYLFCPIYQFKAIERSLSTDTVKRIIKSAAKKAGLEQAVIDAFSGHSLRVGAAQDLLCSGHETAAIMRAGGWKSINVLARYLEMAEQNVWA